MIYICIPTHDESATIGLLLWKVRRVMDDFPRDYELLVLDDASTDGTQDVLAPYARVLPLTVLKNAERQGYAASVERLLREAVARASHPRRDMAIVLQADFSDSPEEIPTIVKRIEGGVDLVATAVGERPPEEPRGARLVRRVAPWLFRRAGLPEAVQEPLTGFRAYRLAVVKKALADRGAAALLTSEGWASNVELLLAMAPFARRIECVACAARPERRQRATRFRAWGSFVQLWEVARRTRRVPAVVEESDAAA